MGNMRPTAEIATGVVFREKSAVAGALSQRSTMPNDDDRPATKQDLNDLRNELHGGMDQLRTEVNGNMSRLREELVEQMRDMQTEVLRAFHGWASPIEIRLRALPDMEERLVLLEERVSGIERREKRT